MFNSKRELVDDVSSTVDNITITWTTHEPTASTAMTVADGSSPTVVETGVFMASVVAEIAKIKVDIAAILAAQNA